MGVEPILDIQSVTKDYGTFRALDAVSLQVYPGEIFALLGPNGAGKTTLISCISGLIHAFGGRITVGGHEVRASYPLVRQLIGLVPQELNFDGFFKARHVLEYQGGFFGVRNYRHRAAELLEAFSLKDKAEANSRWLSGGMKRRLMICKALVHKPPLLFLDEPTAGVDVELRDELWAYVRQLRASGTTVFLTTHYLEEAEQLADRVGVIHGGRLAVLEKRDELLNRYGERWVEVVLDGTVEMGAWDRLPCHQVTLTAPNRWRFSFKDTAQSEVEDDPVLPLLLSRFRALGVTPLRLEGGRSRLEDIFRRVIGEANAECVREGGRLDEAP